MVKFTCSSCYAKNKFEPPIPPKPFFWAGCYKCNRWSIMDDQGQVSRIYAEEDTDIIEVASPIILQ